MEKLFEILATFAILSNLVDSQFIPIPYRFQNDEDYADRSFANFFNRYPMQTRNETAITQPTTTTTTKKPEPTTDTILYIPVIQETIYQPDYYPIPPYPVFYNAPAPAGFNQFDDFVPYNLANDLPSFAPSRLQSFPFLDQFPNVPSDKIVFQPLPSDIMPAKPTPEQNENIDVEITDADRDLLAAELSKLIGDFFAKKQQKLDAELESYTEKNIDTPDTNNVYEYKVIKPSSTFSPQVSAFPSNSQNTSTKQLDKNQNHTAYNFGDRIKQEINKTQDKQVVSNSSQNASTQNSQVNQFKWTTPVTDIDESRKLHFNGEGETTGTKYEESTTDTSTKKLLPILSGDLIKPLENNLTSVNGSKWYDTFAGEPTKRPILRTFFDEKGNKCVEELVKHEDNEYYLITCVEKSFDDALEHNRKTTYKSDVTYFTQELTTPISEIKAGGTVIFNQATESHSEVEQNTDLTSASEIPFQTTTETNNSSFD